MVYEVILARLPAKASPEIAEKLMVETRMRLLKIPEILNLSCGKRIDSKENPHGFFVAMEFESLAKKRVAYQNPIFSKYLETVLEPSVEKFDTLDFEMDPGKDVRFS